jgi:hypothetical protein
MRKSNTVAVLMPFTHVVALVVLTCSANTAFASNYTFADVIAANSSEILALGINNSGTVAGWYCPSGGGCPVAYTDVNGTFSTFNPAGSIGDYGLGIPGSIWMVIGGGLLCAAGFRKSRIFAREPTRADESIRRERSNPHHERLAENGPL